LIDELDHAFDNCSLAGMGQRRAFLLNQDGAGFGIDNRSTQVRATQINSDVFSHAGNPLRSSRHLLAIC
jgi:hypothetical protein